MTSKRSYRDPIPQQKVREELVKGSGTQFDPQYAKIMVHLIDLDIEYSMREREAGTDDAIATHVRCERIGHDCTIGIPVTQKATRIQLFSKPDNGFAEDECLPSLILFDALDARVHEEEEKKKDLLYFEYARIRFDGRTEEKGVRKMETKFLPPDSGEAGPQEKRYSGYTVEALRVRDHVLIRIANSRQTVECIAALPDSSRFSYISLTGEHCMISNITVTRDKTAADEGSVPRIAGEISYISGCPEGDVPNLQIDGWRSQATKGIPVQDTMSIAFHTRSLPTARLLWHCPFISLFTSGDGTAGGPGYREFLLLRLDGENWESDTHAENEVHIDHNRDFPGWDVWKDTNKEGMDCTVRICREGSRVTMKTYNLGIAVDSVTTIMDDVRDIFVSLTGDQCALTDIRIIPE